jgi:Na+-transporting NADH:ubiquinone oxidoreductase subunit A
LQARIRLGLGDAHPFLEPVSLTKQVWHLNYQDVIAIGKLLRQVSCANASLPSAGRRLQTASGATLLAPDINELLDGETKEGENRLISGSVLSGRHAVGRTLIWRFHLQVSCAGRARKSCSAGCCRRGEILRHPHHAGPFPASSF